MQLLHFISFYLAFIVHCNPIEVTPNFRITFIIRKLHAFECHFYRGYKNYLIDANAVSFNKMYIGPCCLTTVFVYVQSSDCLATAFILSL